MGKRQEKPKTSSIAVDVASLDSIDALHGHMDFFGMDAKKLCNHLHQKLKVVQTWVFIQAVLIVLLIAYTALLGVWLAPFFPMNYDDTSPEGAVITLSGLHSDVSKIEKSMHSSNGSVDYLQVWQKGHEDTHISLNKAVDDIEKQVKLESKIEERVSKLTRQNDEQRKEISSLQSKVNDLERFIRDMKAEGTGRIDQHNIRIRKLECAKDNISSSLSQLVNSTKDQFCKVFEELGSTIGRVGDIERRLTYEIKQDVGVLQQDVDHLKTSMSNVTNALNKTIRRQMISEKRTRDKFIEQDDLRGTALEKQRVFVYAKVGKLQCKLDELEGSLNERIGQILSNTTPSIETCFNQKIKVTQLYLEEKISGLADRMERDIDRAESNFNDGMLDLNDSITNETRERTAQFVHVCDMVEDVKSNATQMFKTVEWETFQSKKHINDLMDTVSHLEKAEAENSDNVASLNTTQQTRRLEFVQFREETIHTGLDINDRMCAVETGLQNITTKSGDMHTRLGIAETTMQDIPIDVRSLVSVASAKTTESMAALKAENEELRALLTLTIEQLAQFAKDLGLGSLDSLQVALRTASSSTAPVAAVRDMPTTMMDPNMPLNDIYNGEEPVPPDSLIYEYVERD